MSTNPNRRVVLRKKRIEQKRRKTITTLLIVFGAVLLISLAAIIPNLLRTRSTISGGEGFTVGDPDAPISVVNFSSFTCPFCENFSKTVEPDLIKNYVDTGEVFYRYMNLAGSDEASQNAGKAAYCAAEQNRFFEYRSYLYSAAHEQNGFTIDNLIRMANTAGLDRESFEICLVENNTIQDALFEDLRFAQSVGVTGTPSFLVNDQLVSSTQLIDLLNSLLNK
jgi:protein-disulfide isomerase